MQKTKKFMMFIFSETTHVWLLNSIIVHWLTFKQLFIIINSIT